MSHPEVKQLIDGAWRDGRGGHEAVIIDPATEAELGRYPVAAPIDVDDAIVGAERGFAAWQACGPERRQEALNRVAGLIRERADRIAGLLCAEGGKPLADARREVLRAATLIEWDAAEGRRLYGRVIPAEAGMHLQALVRPAGVAAAFIAWNFPVGFMARKVGGALAAGCPVILKATEETPATCVAFIACFVDAGLPSGSVSLLAGDPAMIVERLIAAPAVRVVSFTGSTRIGQTIARRCAEHVKRAVLELGGHAPVIVCDDADIGQAVTALIGGKFLNNAGQVCVAPTRFFVARSRYDAFCEAFSAAAREIRVGDGRADGTRMGPMIRERRRQAIESLVADARSRGARVLAGGARLDRPGYFHAPTVLGGVPDEARAMIEEPFGPLALLNPFESLDEAIHRANALPFGLAAYAFTESASRARRLTDGLQTGMLSINHCAAAPVGAPFGGIKDSGYGREGGIEGLREFTVTQFVSHRLY